MNNQILITLKRKLDDISAYGNVDVETQRNILKEELQFYVLNFIYHHPDYSNWTMYGGSALRICHGLDRMLVDLDFEVAQSISNAFLCKLKEEIETHFKNTFGSGPELLTISITNGRGLLLRFHIGDELGIKHPSKQVHVKIDLNHFTVAKAVIERRPINRDQLSFVIKTYNMSTLMASKIAAIFLRGQRGVGKAIYEEKGRDIYDLLWYMDKKALPNLDYLAAKGIDANDPRALFDKLTLQMNKVNDTNLKQDLTPLFVNQTFIENWLKNWRESYLRLHAAYKIHTVTALKSLDIRQDFHTDNFSFVYWYNTEDEKSVKIIYSISDDWIEFRSGDLSISVDEKIKNMVEFDKNVTNNKYAPQDKLIQYAVLFCRKTENYLKKTNRIMLGGTITTKLIRMTTHNLNQKDQIVLNKSALLSCELDNLLK
ncbi:MAG: nucleotidyl transferase AbiEii/AbiGii toxin family protein [bacterium]